MKQKHQLLVLFLKTLYISAFTFGGGFVIVTFMKKCFVDELHWIDEQEMLDFTALAQSCPGAIAVNGAILVGWKVYGFAGMVVAVIGTADGDSGGFIRLLRRVCVERLGGSSTRGNASRRGGCDSGCFLWTGSECSEGKKAVFNCNHDNCVPG